MCSQRTSYDISTLTTGVIMICSAVVWYGININKQNKIKTGEESSQMIILGCKYIEDSQILFTWHTGTSEQKLTKLLTFCLATCSIPQLFFLWKISAKEILSYSYSSLYYYLNLNYIFTEHFSPCVCICWCVLWTDQGHLQNFALFFGPIVNSPLNWLLPSVTDLR